VLENKCFSFSSVKRGQVHSWRHLIQHAVKNGLNRFFFFNFATANNFRLPLPCHFFCSEDPNKLVGGFEN